MYLCMSIFCEYEQKSNESSSSSYHCHHVFLHLSYLNSNITSIATLVCVCVDFSLLSLRITISLEKSQRKSIPNILVYEQSESNRKVNAHELGIIKRKENQRTNVRTTSGEFLTSSVDFGTKEIERERKDQEKTNHGLAVLLEEDKSRDHACSEKWTHSIALHHLDR